MVQSQASVQYSILLTTLTAASLPKCGINETIWRSLALSSTVEIEASGTFALLGAQEKREAEFSRHYSAFQLTWRAHYG